MKYLKPMISRFGLQPFFPTADASAETGRKRGSVVLCRESEVAAQMSEVTTLRRG